MTRLPYDNDQSHKVKYVDYKIEDPIAIKDIVTVPQETRNLWNLNLIQRTTLNQTLSE